nr:reverse transcriptase domain-containing protein [Tanacetum cinerariifolium]
MITESYRNLQLPFRRSFSIRHISESYQRQQDGRISENTSADQRKSARQTHILKSRLQADPCLTRVPLRLTNRNYHKLLPIIAEKVQQEKVKQEKLKAVKARLNFEEASQYSKSGTTSRRRSLKERLGSRHVRSMSGSLELGRGHSESPRKSDPKRKTVFKRLEKGVFHRLRDKGNSTSAYLNDSRRRSYHNSRENTKSCYQSSRSRETKFAFKKHHNKIESSRKTKALPESEVWFDDLPKESIDSYDDLKKVFLENYLQLKKYVKDLIEIHNIKQRDGESTKEFTRRYKLECRDIKGAPKCMKISGFMHGITNPEVIKRLHDKIPKSVDEMMKVTIAFLRGEVAASNRERKKSFPSWKQQEAEQKQNFKNGGFQNQQRPERKQDRFTLLTKTPKEILALDKGKFKPPPPMTTQAIRNINVRMDKFHGCKVTIYIQWNHRKARSKENLGSSFHSSQKAKIPNDRQKKRGQAPKRNKAVYEEVEKLVDASIMKEVHYHSWLSNPVMIKKHDESWRMCVDFKDLNKACPKDGYSLPEIGWKVESLCGYPFKCFLDAYKGYHQIKMAKKDEEKTTFFTSQGIFCYSKIPFELKNAGATYQRLVDKAFQKQIGRNFEVYVDDLVIRSRTKQEIIRDIEETFKTLREINMKLNPSECTFGMREGMFLGYKVNGDELRVSSNKVEAVLSLPSPKCMKDVQRLNGNDFQWTSEAETAFKQMKTLLVKLPMLTAPKEKEELVIYLAAAKEAVSTVLMTKRDGKQMPIYFVSHALQGSKINYTLMEKLILALMLSSLEVAGRLLKSRFELEGHDIHYRPRTSVKGQFLADFIVEHGSSCIDGSRASLIITNPKGMEFTYALRFRFRATNNEAEYEALIAGLRIAEQIGVKNLQANVKNLAITFKEFSIKQVPRGENKKADALSKMASTSYAHLSKQVLVEELKEKSIDGKEEILREEKRKARAIRRKAGLGKVKFLIVVVDYFNKWIEAKPVVTITGAQIKKFIWDNIVCRFSLPGEHPQANDLVEMVNRSLGEGIKVRLDERSKNWMEEISHVLWAHRTMIKSNNEETPFSLTYRTEAVIPVEIGMPTLRTVKVDMIKNDEALENNLDILEEKSEQAAIQEAKSKAMMEKYYNARVHNTSFKLGDLVYRSNEASHSEDGGKVGAK